MVNLKELVMILELHREGLSISAIAEQTGKDRKTIRKYIRNGMVAPSYTPRPPEVRLIDPYMNYIAQRIQAYPGLSASRLMREIRAMGYQGGRTILAGMVSELRPVRQAGFEVRFETAAGKQAQVDFAHFKVMFAEEPGVTRTVWLFAMVLGHSRYLWGQFVLRQDLPTVLRCHMQAFEHFGGVPQQILYDRMKTAVLGEDQAEQHIVYNAKLLSLAKHYDFSPRACKAYRAQTKGKIERPYRYIRQDFFLGREFASLDDMNSQLADWLAAVANARTHGTTNRVVVDHFAEERPALGKLPAMPFGDAIRIERRISHDGFVSVGSNLYSVPDGTRKRVLEVEMTPTEVRIHEAGSMIAVHQVLQGRRQRSFLPGHRVARNLGSAANAATSTILGRPGHVVARRSLSVYDAVARQLARQLLQPVSKAVDQGAAQ